MSIDEKALLVKFDRLIKRPEPPAIVSMTMSGYNRGVHDCMHVVEESLHIEKTCKENCDSLTDEQPVDCREAFQAKKTTVMKFEDIG